MSLPFNKVLMEGTSNLN